ncbi:MAG: glycogen/starch/alpha-glucan phosphorylase [Sulfolobaceae archaeon]|nr:glycogen/starch/alpha-glucan phosphorylase [Sulfolobaceae archaeon]
MVIVSITPEIALDEFPVFAGGLGVLEGDKFYEMNNRCIDYYVLTILYRNGYVEYDSNLNFVHSGYIRDFISKMLIPEEEISFEMGSLGKVVARPQIFRRGPSNVVFFQPLSPDRVVKASEQLYIEESPEDFSIKYLFLARASLTYIIERIGMDNIDTIDLQEATASLIALILPDPLLRKTRLIIHTPGPWGHPYISQSHIEKFLGKSVVVNSSDNIMITKASLTRVSKAFAVSKKQEELVKKMFPEYSEKITHVTNAVNLDRWTHPEITKLLKRNNGKIDGKGFLEAHRRAKKDLFNLLRNYKSSIQYNEDLFFVSWVRRITPYKRPYFAYWLIEELKDNKDLIFIIGGKAHPKDGLGIEWMRKFKELSDKYNNVVFIYDYDIIRAKLILSGSDLLLFTPFSGWEASGTSFMKAGINGVPTLASRDGAVLEIINDGENGWLFGKDLRDFINIFTETEKVKKIDEEDYREMKSSFSKIYDIYRSNRERYLEVQLNALRTFREKADISRLLKEYGYIS